MIERAPFGATGHESSRVIFGGAALQRLEQSEADGILPLLLAHGVNHLDVAPAYGRGIAESRLRPWLAAHRADFFLATKTKGRTATDARIELEQSLERMGVDHVDLIQLHNLVEEEDWQQAHGAGGAVEGLQKAREEGLTRFIGVTGHGTRIPRMHLRGLERFDFDSVLIPYNYALSRLERYRNDVEELLEVCAGRRIAVQVIKFAARRRWEESDRAVADTDRRSWYEAIDQPEALERAASFILGREGLFLIASSDRAILAATLEAAEAPAPLPDDKEMARDLADLDLRPLFDGGRFERA